MSWQRSRAFVRDDGETEIEVEYTIESTGYPGNNWDDPGEGPELHVDRAWILIKQPGGSYVDGDDVTLTDAERERIEEALCSDPDLIDFLDDGPDD